MSNYTIHPGLCPCPRCGGPNRQHKGPTIYFESEASVNRERRLGKDIVDGDVITSETVFVEDGPQWELQVEKVNVLDKPLRVAWEKYYRSIEWVE